MRPSAAPRALAALWVAWCLVLGTNVPAVPNPVLIPARGNAADCGVMKFNGDYYIIGNSLAGDMFISSDLVHWGNRTHVFSMNNDWTPGNTSTDRNINACDPSYYNGIFNLYWSVDRGDQGVVQIGHAISDKPLGPYHEPERAHWFDGKIDAHLYRDDDGSFYFYSVKFNAGNQIWGRRMRDPSTLVGEPRELLSAQPHTWELLDDSVNEGPFVLKYRNRYYLIYNANHTAKGHYALGCAEADSPLGFSNRTKYADPVVEQGFPAEGRRLTQPGQPSIVRGPNGMEWWLVYFLEVDGARRQQAIDRVLFFDQRLYVDGPTSVASPGYHPVPSQPERLDLFDAPDGSALASHWQSEGGKWTIKEKTARQTEPVGRGMIVLGNSPMARQYLVETSVRLLEDTGAEAGVIAFWRDAAHWMSVTLDARHGTWNVRKVENNAEIVERTLLPKGFNFQAWHSLRVAKNGANFEIHIDERPAPGLSVLCASAFEMSGAPGLFTDAARAAFDGFIHTIGWDETEAAICGWGQGINGGAQRGMWSVTPKGLTQSNATEPGRIFKGDPAAQCEFTAQLTRDDSRPLVGGTHRMGMLPVYVDDRNYLQADIDLARWELRASGRKAGEALAVQTAPLPRRFPLPTSEHSHPLWRYTTEAPGTNWVEADFTDDGWKTGAGAFSETGSNTAWDAKDLWLRRHFELDSVPTGMARLRLLLQGDAEIYLNGVQAMRGPGRTNGYESYEITDAARRTLRQGRNSISIHAHKTGPNQVIDAGLFLAGIVESPGSVNLRAVKLNDRVILFVNGRQLLEVAGAWPASQVGLTTEAMACHFSGLTYFQIH